EVEKILKPLLDDGTITKLFTISGRWDYNRAWIEAPLADWSKRDVTEGELARKLNEQIGSIPGAQGRIQRTNSLNLRNADGGLEFALTGSNYAHISEATHAFVRKIEQEIPQLQNLRVEFRETQPQISVEIDRRRASDL